MSNPFDEHEKYKRLLDEANRLSQIEKLVNPYRDLEKFVNPYRDLDKLVNPYRDLEDLTRLVEANGLSTRFVQDNLHLKSALDAISSAISVHPLPSPVASTLLFSVAPLNQLYATQAFEGIELANLSTTLKSLSTDQHSTLIALDAFHGTLNSATSLAHAATLLSASVSGPNQLLALDASVAISRFVASTSAVQSFETSLATIASQTYPMAELSSGFSIRAAYQLQQDVNLLTSAADAFVRAATTGYLSPFISAPALEIYTAAHSAAALVLDDSDEQPFDESTEREIDNQLDAFEARLHRLDPDLVTTYRGALHALENGGPDWQRHLAASFRELTTQVLHRLAPDEDILALAQEGDLQNGKPTRVFRLRVIFQPIIGPDLAPFISADIEVASKLFRVLNEQTHTLSHKLTTPQARYLKARIVALLTTMLEAKSHLSQPE